MKSLGFALELTDYFKDIMLAI